VTSSFLYDPAPTKLNWRSLFGAFYVQDTIRFNPQWTVTLGFRDEFSTGWNEAHGRAANYTFTNGVISNQPRIASSAFTENNAKFLPAPRIGIAYNLYPGKTVIRAGFGMYYELLDPLGYRMDQNAPFNPTYSIANLQVSKLPINPAAPVPSNALVVPGGVQPDASMPTLISYTLGMEQQLTLVGRQHHHADERISLHRPTQLQPSERACRLIPPGRSSDTSQGRAMPDKWLGWGVPTSRNPFPGTPRRVDFADNSVLDGLGASWPDFANYSSHRFLPGSCLPKKATEMLSPVRMIVRYVRNAEVTCETCESFSNACQARCVGQRMD